jgi:hypothetical protein
MNSFTDKAKDVADQHDDKVDQAVGKVGDKVDDRTDGKYTEQIDKGTDYAQQHTGHGDTNA